MAVITEDQNVRMDAAAVPVGATAISGASPRADAPTTECDPIQLAIFSHRFMGIAEQMGRTLQRTSIRCQGRGARGRV